MLEQVKVYFLFLALRHLLVGEGNDNPLQCSCLENSMDRGARWAIVHGVARVGHDLPTKSSSSSHLLVIKSLSFS